MSETIKKLNPYLTPVAIVIAGLIIAIAILNKDTQSTAVVPEENNEPETSEVTLSVTERDHVRGPRDADVFLIEYSDYRCGYCGLFHETVTQLLNEDAYSGRVAWVYRHTPYQPGGKEAAVASECVAEQLGEEGFWEYTDRAFENQRQLSDKWHVDTAVSLGADKTAFEECVSSGKYDDLLREYITEAQSLGARGTPFSALLTKDGEIVKFSGAQPYERVIDLVDRALGLVN
jgi:protein-disulfide isomerase